MYYFCEEFNLNIIQKIQVLRHSRRRSWRLFGRPRLLARMHLAVCVCRNLHLLRHCRRLLNDQYRWSRYIRAGPRALVFLLRRRTRRCFLYRRGTFTSHTRCQVFVSNPFLLKHWTRSRWLVNTQAVVAVAAPRRNQQLWLLAAYKSRATSSRPNGYCSLTRNIHGTGTMRDACMKFGGFPKHTKY